MSLVAIVGRPNVGKSTLFNRLVGERQAIVDATAAMNRTPAYVEEHFTHNNHILLYPVQAGTESELLKTM